MSQELLNENIKKAQEEIEKTKDKVSEGKMRQNYHFMAQQGWINDPNGLIYYKNKYHFFYHYNPYDAYWGAMHWGHAISDDMLHWEYLPVALAPSEPYDNHKEGGCFSGSAIEHDGKLYLVYTGTTNYGDGFIQSQCLAYSEDGVHFEKYENNPIIPHPPEGYDESNFRDPKVWKHGDYFYLVCGSKKNNLASALLYRSKDLKNWEFFNVLAESRGEFGYMWECPDFYEIGDKHVLMFSPMGINERTSVYLVGDMNYDTGKFTYTNVGQIDYGFDYYAPQSFLDSKGRRIIVGWANAWDWMPWWKDWGPSFKEGWCGFFDLPREVVLCPDNTLKFVPIKEIENIRKEEKCIKEISVTKEEQFNCIESDCFEMEMDIDLESTTADKFSLLLRCNENNKTKVTFDLKHQMLYFDRNNSDNWSEGIARGPLILKDKKNMKIRAFVDKSSIEVYTDDYKTNCSCNVFADSSQTGNYIVTDEGCLNIREIKMWELKETIK